MTVPKSLRRSHLAPSSRGNSAVVVPPPPTGSFILLDNQLDNLLLDDNTSKMLRDG